MPLTRRIAAAAVPHAGTIPRWRNHLQRDHHPRSRQTDRADALAAHLRQARKRVLAERAAARKASVATLLGLAQRLIRLALALGAISIARFT
ncbi:hypothetical protein [Tahibacter soli]|uniref:hypothetical protein n=1 Tax=Tahibacter soli TaxID=2983605 RepID=UPI003CCE0E58